MPKPLQFIARATAAGALVALVLPAASPSFAASDSLSFKVTGIVPTICRAEFASSVVPIAGQTTDLGSISEVCNDWEGYRVTLITPPGVAGSAILDGTTIPLAANGQTVIVDSNSDADRERHLKLQLAAGSAPIAPVKLTTTPKGVIY